MTTAEWEALYEMLGIIQEIVSNSNVYSASLAKRVEVLEEKLSELPTKDD